MKKKFTWTQDAIDSALAMYRAGKSYTMIAEILTKVTDQDISRGSIAGVVHRYAKVKMGGPSNVGRPPRKKAKGPSKKPRPLPTMEIDEPHPKSKEVPFNDLETGMCKWATAYGFCGHDAGAGKPYCSYHTKRSMKRYEK